MGTSFVVGDERGRSLVDDRMAHCRSDDVQGRLGVDAEKQQECDQRGDHHEFASSEVADRSLPSFTGPPIMRW